MTTSTAMPAPGTATRSRVEWATVPRVDLLPPEIGAEQRFRERQRLLGLAVLAVVVLAGALTLWAELGVNSAQDALDATQSQTATLQRQKSQYAEVPRVLAQVDAAMTARQAALGRDVLWYRFLTDLAANTPAQTSFDTLNMSMDAPDPNSAASTGAAGATAAAAGTQEPFAVAKRGTVTIGGKAGSFPDVANWLINSAKVHGLDASTLQSASRDDGTNSKLTVTFASTLTVTPDALSHRYDRKAG